MRRNIPVKPVVAPNNYKSLDASGGSASRNLLGAAKGALIRAAAATQPLGGRKHMSFILIPNKGDDIQVNAWNWRSTLEFLRAQNIITTDHAELLGCNGCGARVDADLAKQMAAAVENKLATIGPGDRMRVDLTVTSAPKVPQIFGPDIQANDIDVTKLYSAKYEWLVTFKDFCNRGGGFEVS